MAKDTRVSTIAHQRGELSCTSVLASTPRVSFNWLQVFRRQQQLAVVIREANRGIRVQEVRKMRGTPGRMSNENGRDRRLFYPSASDVPGLSVHWFSPHTSKG